jgi:hypothetical protein
MRNDEDIKTVIFTLTGKVEIDMERVEEDPNWVPFVNRVLSGVLTLDEALKQYLAFYFGMEMFPRNTPVTNGPADFLGLNLELKEHDAGRRK